MTNDYEKAVEALSKDLKDLRADMKVLAGAFKERARERFGDAKESVSECATHHFDQLHEAADDIGRACRHGVATVSEKIEQRPLTSLLAAIGVGVILGRLLGRRR